MLREDKKLKRFLVLQSFCPLFLLIFIKRVDHLIFGFHSQNEFFHCDGTVIDWTWNNCFLGDLIITLLCIVWFVITFIVSLGFNSLQNSGYDHYGETIMICSEKKDSGISFLVSFVLPLLVDDISTLGNLLFFIVLLVMVVFLLVRSDLFYQNPVLVALRYKTYEFKFDAPNKDVKENKTYIGLSKGGFPSEGVTIKRKYIADDVFLIYNDETGCCPKDKGE